MKNKTIHTYLSREQSLALYAFMRHPALTTEGLSFVGFVAVSDPFLERLFLHDLQKELAVAVEPVANAGQLTRIYREGRSDTVYLVLCRRFGIREAGSVVYPPMSLYRDFIFERRLKHIYIGDAGFIASAHASLPDLFLINQAVLSLENLRAEVEKDLALVKDMRKPVSTETEDTDRLNLLDWLEMRPFNLSDQAGKLEARKGLADKFSPYTDIFVSINLATGYMAAGESQQAVDWLDKAGRLAEGINSRRFRRAVELHRAFLHLYTREWGKAETCFRSFLADGRPDDPAVHLLSAYAGLGYARMRRHCPSDALRYFRYAAEESRKAALPVTEAFAWLHIGGIKAYQGDERQARTCYRKALHIYHSLRSRLPFAFCLLKLGYSYLYTADADPAIACFKAARSIYRVQKLNQGKAAAWVGLAFCEKEEEGRGNNLSKRMCFLKKAAALWKKEQDDYRVWQVEYYTGICFWYQKNLQGAAEAYKKMQMAAENIAGEAEETGPCLDRLAGLLALSEGMYEKAAVYLSRALAYFEGIDDKRNCLYLYGEMGRLDMLRKEYASSLSFFREGLQIALKTGNLTAQYRLHKALADLYAEKGETEEARKQQMQADRLAEGWG